MLDRYLEKFERKLGKFAVERLMLYIVIGMALVYAADFILAFKPDNRIFIQEHLAFNLQAIKQGEVWRVISFLLIPPFAGHPFFMIFELYFLLIFGDSLEHQWGSLKFNVFYLIGTVSTIIVGLILGFASNTYLNLSLFLAFAIVFPNYEVWLFFVLPVKVKWMGMLDAVLLIVLFIAGNWSVRLMILVAFANIILFFGRKAFGEVYYTIRRYYYKWFRMRK